jgi:hypothetical protein
VPKVHRYGFQFNISTIHLKTTTKKKKKKIEKLPLVAWGLAPGPEFNPQKQKTNNKKVHLGNLGMVSEEDSPLSKKAY